MKFEMLVCLYASPVSVCYDNDNDAWIPEQWAMESLVILEESVVMSGLVHRDFEAQVQNFGDVVNTRRPAKFYSARKTDADSVVEQEAVSANVAVPLNQHHYNTFIIKDGEGSKSFAELVQVYLRPSVQAVARGVDRSVIGQAHAFLAAGPTKRVGGLGTSSSSNVRARLVEAREKLNVLNVPEDEMRHVIMTAGLEADMLNTDLFVKANESGTVNALRRAQIGRLFGFGLYAANNVPSATTGDTVAGTITAAHAAGATAAKACSIASYEATVGEWFTVAGNDQPEYATAVTASTNTTSITSNEANKNATEAAAVVTLYKKCVANGGYALGYSKEIAVDGFTVAPTAGRMLATGTGGSRKIYTIIESREGSGVQYLLLDRPLEAAITNDDNLFPGPVGDMNLAFHRNALALVTRPLARPNSAAGVMSAVASSEANKLSMRICMQYDSTKQGTRVTCDMLSGVALLDINMGCLILG